MRGCSSHVPASANCWCGPQVEEPQPSCYQEEPRSSIHCPRVRRGYWRGHVDIHSELVELLRQGMLLAREDARQMADQQQADGRGTPLHDRALTQLVTT
jgi:hypothetical protein